MTAPRYGYGEDFTVDRRERTAREVSGRGQNRENVDWTQPGPSVRKEKRAVGRGTEKEQSIETGTWREGERKRLENSRTLRRMSSLGRGV